MNAECTLSLAEIQIAEQQAQSLIDAYDTGYEAKRRERCPYAKGTPLATNWHLGREHAQCDGRV